MRMLDRKLLQNLRRIWVQALPIAGGVVTYVLASGAYHSLEETRRAYNERYRFGDIFAEIKRAPKSVGEQILGIDGVTAADVTLCDPRCAESRRAGHRPGGLHSREGRGSAESPASSGRLPGPDRRDEVVVNEAFCYGKQVPAGRHLQGAAQWQAVYAQRRRHSTLTGVHLGHRTPGDLVPDDRRFAVMWMSDLALGGMFDLEGAFNSLSVRLLRDARGEQVIATLDAILARYGGMSVVECFGTDYGARDWRFRIRFG